MKIVQVCNVGTVCGGTAACAWSITRALPECQHVVLFLGRPTTETRNVFAPLLVKQVSTVDDDLLARWQPDLVILHNTSAAHVGPIRQTVTLQYCHSQGNHASGDFTVSCSGWLSCRLNSSPRVLYQPIPRPPVATDRFPPQESRFLDDELVIGRLCTPQPRKWPAEIIPFYADLSQQFPGVRWEFVGCPRSLEPPLQEACQGRATFLAAGWEARRHFHRWHALLYHHPSLTESFGRTVAEAMLAGCLPIVDARGGFLEQIRQGETGFLCHSPADFSSALEELSPPRRWTMSRSARQSAEAQFSLQTFAREFRLLLKSL